jgi:hypothetical protein
MNSKKISKLVLASYDNSNLNQKRVSKIASLISKTDLKKYINGLKLEEKKKNLIISSPIDNFDTKMFKKLFPHKKIIFKKNSSLMLGIKVEDNDIIYDFTLKNSFEKILRYIEQNYD